MKEKIKNKIKICFIAKSVYFLFDPKFKGAIENIYGGVDVDIYMISKELAKDKYFDVSVIVGDFGQDKIVKKDNVTLIKSYEPYKNKFLMASKLMLILLKNNSDIYFLEKANGLNGIFRFISKIKKKKLIYRTASDIDCDKTFINNNKIEGLFYKYALEKADLVIVQNENNKNQLSKNHNKDSIIIKNGITLNSTNFKGKKFITWIGRREIIKRPELFLELSKSFPKYNFLMICPKVNINNDDLIENEINNILNINFIEYVPFDKINNYYKKAKILINTSDYEGFPNTFVQATANGTPIVSLNVNPDNFLNKYKCGFCANGNFELMKNQIKGLLEDKELYNKMSKNSYEYAKRNHDIKKIIKQYKKVFIDLYNDKIHLSQPPRNNS